MELRQSNGHKCFLCLKEIHGKYLNTDGMDLHRGCIKLAVGIALGNVLNTMGLIEMRGNG